MRVSLLPQQPVPHLPPAPTLPEVTFTVRGIRLVNREWSLRDACFPITITTSPRDPNLSSVEAEIMLRDDAVGLYHHESRTYIPLKEIYTHSEYLNGSQEQLQTRNSSHSNHSSRRSDTDLTNSLYIPQENARKNYTATPASPSTTPNGKVIWDVVYRRPGVYQPPRHSFDSDDSSCASFFEDDDEDGEKKTSGKWADLKRCAWILWDGTYVFLSIKRPLIYLDDLQRGVYCTTWKERGIRKVGGWFGKKEKEGYRI